MGKTMTRDLCFRPRLEFKPGWDSLNCSLGERCVTPARAAAKETTISGVEAEYFHFEYSLFPAYFSRVFIIPSLF